MGGLYSGIAEMAGRSIGKVFSKDVGSIAAKTAGNELIEKGVYRGVFSAERSFEQHPHAKAIWDDLQKIYKPKVEQYKSIGTKLAQQAGGTQPAQEIESAARKRAMSETFGPNRVRIQAMLKNVEKQHSKNMADILADHLNIEFKESVHTEGKFKGKSSFDVDMARGDEKKQFNTPVSPYKGREDYENTIGKLRGTLAYKAAPIHMANALLNIASEDGLSTLGKTLATIWGPGRAGAEAAILHSNAISDLTLNDYKEHLNFQKSGIAKYAPGGIGEFIHKNMYIPGMSRVRRESILMGAYSGKLMAEEAAARLANGDKKYALPALERLGLDASKITQQGHKLSPEDIAKAYYHGANNKVFLDPYDSTPSFWRQSPLWRSTKAFSGYVTKQNKFERQLILRQYRQGDFIGLARNLSMKALVYPIVGSTLYEFDRLLTGSDWDDPSEHYKNRIEATPAGMLANLALEREQTVSSVKTISNTLDMLARLGVWGSTTGYIRGMNRANLAQHVLPPEVNVGIQLGQDMFKASHYDENHSHAADPLGRDLLADTPSLGIGSILSHKLLPTRKEQKFSNPSRSSQRRRKKESSNPFNTPDFTY